MKFTVINEKPRHILAEGRSHGIGHDICKREGSVLTMIMPETACKDFLSDQVYSENSGKPYSVYGFKCKKESCFDTHAYLTLSVLKSNGNPPYEYTGWKKEVEDLNKNYAKVGLFLNKFEELFKFKDRTEVHPVGDNLFAMVVPIEWVKQTYLISLYTLLARNALKWDGKQNVLAYIVEMDKCPEAMTFLGIMPKIQLIIEGTNQPQDFTKTWNVHSCGIVGWDVSKKHV